MNIFNELQKYPECPSSTIRRKFLLLMAKFKFTSASIMLTAQKERNHIN